MIAFPNIDPVALQLGPLKVHWYGLMYLLGFVAAWILGTLRAKRPDSGWKADDISDLIFYTAVGIILGGRIGYLLFYGLDALLRDPLSLFKVWQGGMSFHGGLIGSLIALWLFSRKINHRYFEVLDFVAPLVPIGIGAGRFANFINGELWGKTTDVPWGVIFPGAGDLPRHPSQIYEALLEGVMLFIILWLFTAKPRPMMSASGLALLCYGLFRSFVEFYRLPDAHIEYIAFGWLTMGQLLSLPMILGGLFLLTLAYKRKGI